MVDVCVEFMTHFGYRITSDYGDTCKYSMRQKKGYMTFTTFMKSMPSMLVGTKTTMKFSSVA